MPTTPSTHDLEITGQALMTLERRGATTWSVDRFNELIRPRAGFRGEDMLVFCELSGLLQRVAAGWRLTEQGVIVVSELGYSRWGALGTAALRSGAYEDEIARLLEAGSVADEHLRCPLARVARVSPAAGALLAWDPRHREDVELVVPLAELDSLLAISAMEQSVQLPEWVEDNQSVGWRAELYSLRRERTRLGPHRVLHVSRDVGDGFGYDIETTAAEPSRYIEVKGSRSTGVSFVLTNRELSVARRHEHRYELHFWGGISLGRDAREEFSALVAQGYPIILTQVAATIEGEGWSVEGQSWRVTAPPGYRAEDWTSPRRLPMSWQND